MKRAKNITKILSSQLNMGNSKKGSCAKTFENTKYSITLDTIHIPTYSTLKNEKLALLGELKVWRNTTLRNQGTTIQERS